MVVSFIIVGYLYLGIFLWLLEGVPGTGLGARFLGRTNSRALQKLERSMLGTLGVVGLSYYPGLVITPCGGDVV